MEPIIGYWLDPAIGGLPRTPKLGVRLEGRSELRPNSSTKRCPYCGGQLSLFATYENSAFIHLSKFALISLEFCPACSAETMVRRAGTGSFPYCDGRGIQWQSPRFPTQFSFTLLQRANRFPKPSFASGVLSS